MSFFCDSYPIVDKKALGEGIYSYTLKCPEVAENAHIGQFVQIKAEGYMLRRPISICSVDKENGTMRLVFEVRGKGTDKISELNKGDLMDVIAPQRLYRSCKEGRQGDSCRRRNRHASLA